MFHRIIKLVIGYIDKSIALSPKDIIYYKKQSDLYWKSTCLGPILDSPLDELKEVTNPNAPFFLKLILILVVMTD